MPMLCFQAPLVGHRPLLAFQHVQEPQSAMGAAGHASMHAVQWPAQTTHIDELATGLTAPLLTWPPAGPAGRRRPLLCAWPTPATAASATPAGVGGAHGASHAMSFRGYCTTGDRRPCNIFGRGRTGDLPGPARRSRCALERSFNTSDSPPPQTEATARGATGQGARMHGLRSRWMRWTQPICCIRRPHNQAPAPRIQRPACVQLPRSPRGAGTGAPG